MTNLRIEPDDERYTAIYQFWLKNDRPAYCYMASGTYMTLFTDNILVFIQVNMSTEGNWNSLSTGLGS